MTSHFLARNEGEVVQASDAASSFGVPSQGGTFLTQAPLGDPQGDEGVHGHVLALQGVRPDDDLVVGPSLSLLDSPGHIALLRHWASFVAEGRVIVSESRLPGGLDEGALMAILGDPLETRRVEGRRWYAFPGRSWHDGGTPIDWWHVRGPEVVAASLAIQDADLDPSRLDHVRPGIFLEAGEGAIRQAKSVTPKELGAIWSYQVWASLAKVAVLAWLQRELSEQLSAGHVDLGPGPGLIGAGLILDPSTSIQSSTGLELRAIGPWSGCLLAGPALKDLEGLWRFRLGSASTWTGADDLGLFTALGSLLYLPRADARAILERAWDSLRPGGLLVIHENIRHRRFVADHDVMFERSELESLLEPFGEIRFAAATSCRFLKSSDVLDKTVFRVLRKSG